MEMFNAKEMKRLRRLVSKKHRLAGLIGFIVCECLMLVGAGIKIHLSRQLADTAGFGILEIATSEWEGNAMYSGVHCMSRELVVEAMFLAAGALVVAAFFFVGRMNARLFRKTLALVRGQQSQ